MENEINNIKIKVLGIGGGGNNAVNRIILDKVQNIETYIINTETKILKRANTKNILQIGKETTKGLGAGSNPDIGEKSALENTEEIKQILQDTDLVFLTAGMGGGTGTGAISVIAQLAKEMGILTVAIVTKPFAFEGNQRKQKANIGIEKLKENVNALIVILNDNLIKISGDKTSVNEAFSLADNVLKQGIQSITDLITNIGEINLDFADLKTVLNYKGQAYMGIGTDNNGNIVEATKKAIANPLTETQIDEAKGIIFNVKGSNNLSLNDINSSIQLINDRVDKNANIFFGTVIDKTLKEDIVVTVIATGI